MFRVLNTNFEKGETMKKGSRLVPILLVFAAIMLIGYATVGLAAHTGGIVTLKDAAGNAITGGASVPYSPKKTCASTEGCHVNSGVSAYESHATTVTKQQGSGTSYDVSVPGHGVTAGYHFQQGLNVPWGATQRTYYSLPSFTSSPGMAGKY